MLQRKICVLSMVLIGLAFFSVSNATAQQTTVMGQNNPAADIQAVQKAFDQGGIINLKGTFDFGNEGRVNITKDVKIIGETNHKGPVTKIKGGFWTFHSPLPAKSPPEAPGPKITIQSIHFDRALWVPVNLAYSSGATISNNKITNVRPFLFEQPIFGMTGVSLQHGIYCGPRITQMMLPPEKRKYTPDVFTGNLKISDNEIDVANDNPIKTMGQGIFVVWTKGATMQISRNTIYNCSRNSIEVLDNYLDKDGRGMIIIQDNKIVTSQEGIPIPSPRTPNGIVAGWFFDVTGGPDPKRNPKYTIINNAIRARGKTSMGICFLTDGAVVVTNAVTTEGLDAISLLLTGANGYIAHNKLEGTGGQAFHITPRKPMIGSQNVFVDNNIDLFKASVCDVFFDKEASYNLFIGPSCKVNDLGSNNLIQMTK